MKASAVIRTLNEAEHLPRLIAGLRQQTRHVDELVVVDSGSTDATVSIAEDAGAAVVRIDPLEFSFGRSLNRGCATASGDVLLIVSAHVYPVYDTYVEHMLRPFAREDTAVVYGRQVGDHRTKLSESRLMARWFPEESIWDQGHPFSNNANAAVRRDVWADLRYDERLTGLEDLEFAQRVIAKGGRVSYVAEAPVVHVHQEPWERIRNRYRREAIAYAQIVDEAPMSAPNAARLALQNIVTDYWHAAREGALLQNLWSVPAFRSAQFLGAWEGFRTPPSLTDELRRRFYYPPGKSGPSSVREPGRRIDYTGLS